MKKFLSCLLSVLLFSGFVFAEELPEPLPKSPEEDCFLELKRIVESDSTFNTSRNLPLKLNEIQKSNGSSNNRSSDVLSLNSYNDFLYYSQLEIPKGSAQGFSDQNITKYPDELDELSENKKFPGNNIYKANKPHIAPILHTDGTSTAVGDFQGHTQYIDGYYVDTKVLTFGRALPNFNFPVRTREPVAASTGGVYPTGLPYDDFREFLMYFHHISPSKEPNEDKQFLSCGLVKTKPTSGRLSNLYVDSYFGNTFDGSYYLVDDESPIETIDGNEFVKASVAIQGLDLARNDFFTFFVAALAYDNGSDFLNETVTFPLQEQAMTDPAGHGDMRQTIADFLLLNLEDDVDQGVENSVVGAGNADIASIFQRLQANIIEDESEAEPLKGTGMALEGGVPFHLYNEIKNIEDPVLREYMEVALVPGYAETFENLDYDELPPFLALMKDCPVSFEEKVDNVAHAIANAGGGENLNQQNVEYKHLEFGACVVPVRDSRLRKLEEQNVYQQALNQAYNQQIDQNITDVTTLSLEEIRALEEESRSFDEQKQAKIEAYSQASDVFDECGYVLLDLTLALKRGDITQEEFDTEAALVREECNDELTSSLQALPESDQLGIVFEENIEEQFQLLTPEDPEEDASERTLPVFDNTPTGKTEVIIKDNSIYFVISAILTFLGCILLIFGILHKKEK